MTLTLKFNFQFNLKGFTNRMRHRNDGNQQQNATKFGG